MGLFLKVAGYLNPEMRQGRPIRDEEVAEVVGLTYHEPTKIPRALSSAYSKRRKSEERKRSK
jgi:hypothetical protein